MIKKCYVLDGQIINLGEWDLQIIDIEIEPAIFDEEGKLVKDAVFMDLITNPMPARVVEQERDFEYTQERGWFEVGEIPQPSDIDILKQENTLLKAQIQANASTLEFQEGLIVELAMMVYP